MRIGVQCSSWGTPCGIFTYSDRLVDAFNKKKGVECKAFIDEKFDLSEKDLKRIFGWIPDVILIQYEPGLFAQNPQGILMSYSQRFTKPLLYVTVHHTNGLINMMGGHFDGFILHSESQKVPLKAQLDDKTQDVLWGSYRMIPHPALVYKKLDKKKIRKELGLPLDKKILGTAGFIFGTGKRLPIMVDTILRNIKDDEFLYLITSFWKGGDMGREEQIRNIVKELGKENNFRMDTNFLSSEEFNKKLQACDLLFSWNVTDGKTYGSNSGVAMDEISSYTKTIVKDVPHYDTALRIEGVLSARGNPTSFAEDVLNALRNEDLTQVPNPNK